MRKRKDPVFEKKRAVLLVYCKVTTIFGSFLNTLRQLTMQPLRYILFILVTLIVGQRDVASAQEAKADTLINQTVNGIRQGRWRIEGKNGKVDEGNYVNGKKHGEWITMTKDSIRKSLVTFNMGVAEGLAIYYHPDGKEMERGIWKVDHWEGEYERFYANGNKSCTFTYGEDGKRTGTQTYYHENGNKMYEGEWTKGKISGDLTVYNEEGKKVLQRHYDEKGKFQSSQQMETPIAEVPASGKEFKSSGTYTLFDAHGRLEYKGQFQNGVLQNGEHYIYDSKGKLDKTEIIRNGKVQSVKKKK